MKNLRLYIIFLFLSTLIANEDCDNCFTPLANAGEDQIHYIGCSDNQTLVCLDASNSYDYEGEDLSYSWTLMTQQQIELDDISSPTPCFYVPSNIYEDTVFEFKLKVSDGQYTSNPDFVVRSQSNPESVLTDYAEWCHLWVDAFENPRGHSVHRTD